MLFPTMLKSFVSSAAPLPHAASRAYSTVNPAADSALATSFTQVVNDSPIADAISGTSWPKSRKLVATLSTVREREGVVEGGGGELVPSFGHAVHNLAGGSGKASGKGVHGFGGEVFRGFLGFFEGAAIFCSRKPKTLSLMKDSISWGSRKMLMIER